MVLYASYFYLATNDIIVFVVIDLPLITSPLFKQRRILPKPLSQCIDVLKQIFNSESSSKTYRPLPSYLIE